MELFALFNFKNHISDSGVPVGWLSSIIKGQILKDKMFLVLNQVLRTKGFASFKVRHDI